MIKYKKYQNKNDKMPTVYGKWFGRAVHEIMEFDEFIEHMANHHCVYSEGTLRGVLIEMEICLRELLLEGKAVRLDDLGIFALSIVNKKGGAAEAKDFTASLITGVRMNLYLGKRFRAAQLFKDAKFKEADKYIGDGNYYEPDPDDENAASENGTTPSGGGSQQGGSQEQSEGFALTISKTGTGSASITINGNSVASGASLSEDAEVEISITPAEGQVPTATINGSDIELTENSGVYTGSFAMPGQASVLIVNTGEGEDDDYDPNA